MKLQFSFFQCSKTPVAIKSNVKTTWTNWKVWQREAHLHWIQTQILVSRRHPVILRNVEYRTAEADVLNHLADHRYEHHLQIIEAAIGDKPGRHPQHRFRTVSIGIKAIDTYDLIRTLRRMEIGVIPATITLHRDQCISMHHRIACIPTNVNQTGRIERTRAICHGIHGAEITIYSNLQLAKNNTNTVRVE